MPFVNAVSPSRCSGVRCAVPRRVGIWSRRSFLVIGWASSRTRRRERIEKEALRRSGWSPRRETRGWASTWSSATSILAHRTCTAPAMPTFNNPPQTAIGSSSSAAPTRKAESKELR